MIFFNMEYTPIQSIKFFLKAHFSFCEAEMASDQ